jgi:hypothetical protein
VAAKADDFQAEINKLLSTAQRCGFVAVEVRAGELHRRIGGYPGTDHRMPICCKTMRKAMGASDAVVQEPDKGAGASFTVRYTLPR